jgi:D-alanine--D-alanine ligase
MTSERPFKLAVICGGPSQERGISLNSARSVMDHVSSPVLQVVPLYVDQNRRFYQISPAQLYSNTPADFDFKLKRAGNALTSKELQSLLKQVDLVFPVIHGAFGEDGALQEMLEEQGVPFVGHSSACCKWMFRKHQASATLRDLGFPSLPQAVISCGHQGGLEEIQRFFKQHGLERAVVKPAMGGSSIGVHSVSSAQEAYARVEDIFLNRLDSQAVIEPFCQGREFTVVVFQNLHGEPVALIPTEVELSYEGNQLFDYRKKYLPTNQASYHTPPRFSLEATEQIRMQAEQLFKCFGMRDFVRLDGWVMDQGLICFTDINPISGLEQNSFFFRQASLLGLSHRQALEYVLKHACSRHGILFPVSERCNRDDARKPVYVLFGSRNAERQVSLMSGTNVWLKLLQSETFRPTPFLYDHEGHIWELPYAFTLNHTVEEIYGNCLESQVEQNDWRRMIEAVCRKLDIPPHRGCVPQKISLSHFMDKAALEDAFVFLALHGGDGENGTLQGHLESRALSFNGSHQAASSLCMDKYLTGEAIRKLGNPDLITIPKKNLSRSELAEYPDLEGLWDALVKDFQTSRLIVKPRCDGCSTGIVLLQSAQDLVRYCSFIVQGASFLPPRTFANQIGIVELPAAGEGDFLFEPYIETDPIFFQEDRLLHYPKDGWVELTIGILEEKGVYRALNPSITIAETGILSLEEKFQGGTGINLTPPPEEILSPEATAKIKHLAAVAAEALGIQNYARLDLFFNRVTEKMVLIEANTLPALTPSTVIYHQGLAEDPPLPPLALLEKMISMKLSVQCQLSGKA